MTQAPPASPPGPPGSNLPEFTVGELSTALKRTIEDGYGHVRVRGEISQPKRHSSGHVYLRLKDTQAVLDAVVWRGVAARLAVVPEEGLEVICTGRVTTYAQRSQYQLIVESMELAGEGALLKMLEERRRRLAAEGLFDQERKRPIPTLPETIGVVTSPTGAVIRDILHRLEDRFPRPVLLWPVAVQGEAAAAQIAGAIAGFDALAPDGPVRRPDVLIVARGGGSLEDLMPFNEEVVVRAVAACRIPVIAAVGHETDTTLIDHAADRRAPTPTAAAEMAVPVRAELMADLLDQDRRRVAAMARLLAEGRLRVDGLARGLGDPQRLLENAVQRLDDRSERFVQAARIGIDRRLSRVREAAARIPSPERWLAEARRRLADAERRLVDAAAHVPARLARQLAPLAGRWTREPVDRRLGAGRDRVAELGDRHRAAAHRLLADRQARLQSLGQLLESFSYENVLKRGYVVVRDADDAPVTDPGALAPGDEVRLQFHGRRLVEALIRGRRRATGNKRQPAPQTPAQGKLL